ncbi:MAG TPA: DUF2520 domain-containing protein [Prolixibacteraceae bacterium]|nr:DUF2520 domain-containing protein [Prolixibacteraceae bacterium]
MINKVAMIGAGNLATQLALALSEKGITINQVYSRTPENAQQLSQKVNSPFTNDLSLVVKDADLYIIAVKDAAVEQVLRNLSLTPNSLIVHTAGSIPMDILSSYTNNFGVFYPLQTFSVDKKVDFSTIPLCLEASNPIVLSQLYELAQKISSSIHIIPSDERKTLHLAAVFVNNFVNHFYVCGAQITAQNGLDFDLLKPLIRETAEKVQTMAPIDAQTGPAKRNDQMVISNHLLMLDDNPELQKIYSFVSDSIAHIHQKPNNDLL